MRKVVILFTIVLAALTIGSCLAEEVYYPLPSSYGYPNYGFSFISLSGHTWKQLFEVQSATWFNVRLEGCPDAANKPTFNLLGLKGELYSPYSDQGGTPKATISGKSTKLKYATFSLALSAAPGTIVSGTCSGYGEYKEGTYYPTYAYCLPCNRGTIGVYSYYDSTDEFYQQSDYSDTYDHTNTTIAGLGCYLCCCCRALNLLGVTNSTPPEVNDYLISQKDGYSKGGGVNPLAIVRYAKKKGVTIGFKRNVPLNEALQRGLYTQVRVKSPSGRSHWVSPISFILNPKTGTVTHRMNDPMYSKRKWKVLESYSTVYDTDTRCFYQGPDPVQVSVPIIIGGPDYTKPTTVTLTEKLGYIGAFTSANISMTLISQRATIQQSCMATIGNSQDMGSGDDDVSTSELTADSIASGSYTLALQGTPGANYSVDIGNYDDRVNGTFETVTGTFDAEGKATVEIDHHNATFSDGVFSIKDFSDGRRVDMSECVVTASIPGEGFYIQPAANLGRTPAYFVADKSGLSRSYMSSVEIYGSVQSSNGVKYIQADNVWGSSSASAPKPVGVPLEKIGTTFHLFSRTYGKITETGTNYLVLNGSLRVNFTGSVSLPIGTFVRADGVEHKGQFYVGNKATIVKI